MGLVLRGERLLVARRAAGAHLEGTWELPGGKRKRDEDLLSALRRELREEVGLEVRDAVLLHRERHDYPERSVELSFFLCRDPEGEPAGLEGQELRWVTVRELLELPFPEGNRRFLTLLAEQLTEP